eukprot:m.462678 g.462678  ORF g.462678 m.462678 type:complete len:76 (+) comp57025_c1_seq1:2953-3180(+)
MAEAQPDDIDALRALYSMTDDELGKLEQLRQRAPNTPLYFLGKSLWCSFVDSFFLQPGCFLQLFGKDLLRLKALK